MKFIKSALSVAVCCVAAQAMAADGEINFTGSITANTCSVSVGDLNGGAGVNVSLGNAPALSLKKAGDTAGAGSFALSMTAPKDDKDCVLTGKTATVRFLSMNGAAGPNGEWLALEGAGGAGVAKNVAVQIRDAKGVDVQLGRASSEYADLTQPMRFTANYIATGEATPGTANAKASFSVDYK
ncbi:MULTISPECIES: fimbrial protein [Pseudomonas]|uniref:fimbrial protein n=1 Tax=Pseudomonas TaxID=286 RepID=UPI000C9BF82A|nr:MULTISPECIES: fimbrial protein [Pseudomonas]AXK52559.1 type 1 fimbrial protein [Pseudomonas protegens]MCL9657107.1 type 1 fimbrial protein [Pseudomonas protegens]MDP4573010.1 fimbrial protein [Pseudomonas sp. LPH60]PNG29377.1 fimbrial protein [Pseudomonas protegens]BCT34109.1 fimbrial subunit type 1 [Pseudomonas protegens]